MGGFNAQRSPSSDPAEFRDHANRHAGRTGAEPIAEQLDHAAAGTSDHRWAELGLPPWISRISLFGSITSRAVRIAAASAGEPLQTPRVRDMLQRLEESGLLVTAVAGDPIRRLRPGTRRDMIETLEREHGDLKGLRHALLSAAAPLNADHSQLIPEQGETDDWSVLEQLILTSSAEFECISHGELAGTAEIPRIERQRRPILSIAFAVTASLGIESDRLDLNLLTRLLLRDARELHGNWREHSGIDAAVVGGTLWMISQASSDLTASSPQLDDAWSTHQELEALIRGANRTGPLPSGASLAVFHTLSAVVSVLRADWTEATRHAEPAMLLAPECGVVGFVAASMLSVASFFAGSPIGRERSERFFHVHQSHNCRSLAWLPNVAALPGFLGALNDLDRARAEANLAAFSDFDAARWFDDSLLLHCAAAKAGILWMDPQRALAAFDGAVGNRWESATPSGGAQLEVGKTRVQLLLNLRDFDQAAQLLDRLEEAYGAEPLISLTARLHLGRGDAQAALSLIDDGLNASGNPARQASLLAMKAAALLMGNSSDAAVDRMITAACVVCEETRSLLPFVLLPLPLLTDLLAVHGPHPDGHPCFLKRNLGPAKLATLQPAYLGIGQPIRLTPRERTLLPLLATPDTLGEIADQLYVSINTVRKQVATLREKLGAKDRRELIARAAELRLLPESSV
ncbi:regulatory LuxR family protein [Propionicimonas paludicola]|uniref:Regulatory LuxR family protein n=2 Tax=Propionicimonas paludicola TaxID=185243 RepID=A0A2A9CSP3_9ACTN|nr:regulatory LuxR family protein [Propionicimonas paludicola]